MDDAYSKDDICIEYIEYPIGTGNKNKKFEYKGKIDVAIKH